jgi:hypothetical protein
VRSRGSIPGGYVRKTISLPAELAQRIEDQLQTTPGVTLSTFMTTAADAHLTKIGRKGR